ncbi:MAG: hypothetical protein PHZ09_05150, partial [Eubacteriales bacterium]|nr:hypothetical protein [Eubacteriales bacterium]
VIDCFFFNNNNNLVIVDYKTDYIPYDLRDKPEIAEKMLADRHRLQLFYYKSACERITRKAVHAVYIYSFYLGKEIEVDL